MRVFILRVPRLFHERTQPFQGIASIVQSAKLVQRHGNKSHVLRNSAAECVRVGERSKCVLIHSHTVLGEPLCVHYGHAPALRLNCF